MGAGRRREGRLLRICKMEEGGGWFFCGCCCDELCSSRDF